MWRASSWLQNVASVYWLPLTLNLARLMTSAYTALRTLSSASTSESYVLASASAIRYLVSVDSGLNVDLVDIGNSLGQINVDDARSGIATIELK